jgi:hypothetical protein
MITSAGKKCRGRGTLWHCWEWLLIQPLWKKVWRFFKNLKIGLSGPVPSAPGKYPKEIESAYQGGICTTMPYWSTIENC